MRKRTVNYMADTIFWYALYFLPVLAYLFYIMGASKIGGTPIINFTEFIGEFADILATNPINVALQDMFGSGGLMPIFGAQDAGILLFFTYFINVYLVHLMVDFLLFIPRYAHKWLKEFTRGE